MESSIIEEAKSYISERRGKPDRIVKTGTGILTSTIYPRYVHLLVAFCEDKGYTQELYDELIGHFKDKYYGIRHKGRGT